MFDLLTVFWETCITAPYRYCKEVDVFCNFYYLFVDLVYCENSMVSSFLFQHPSQIYLFGIFHLIYSCIYFNSTLMSAHTGCFMFKGSFKNHVFRQNLRSKRNFSLHRVYFLIPAMASNTRQFYSGFHVIPFYSFIATTEVLE